MVGVLVIVGVTNGPQTFHKLELFSHNDVVKFHTQFAGVTVGVCVVVGVIVCVTLGVGVGVSLLVGVLVGVDVTVGVIDLVGVGSGDAVCV